MPLSPRRYIAATKVGHCSQQPLCQLQCPISTGEADAVAEPALGSLSLQLKMEWKSGARWCRGGLAALIIQCQTLN